MEAKTKKRIIIWSIVAAVIIALVIFLMVGKSKMPVVTLETQPARTDSIEITITATGEIQPVYKVQVGTQVSGIVEKLYVDYNSVVKKGDLLAELDRSTLLEQVNQAQAMVSNAESSLQLAKQNYDRIKALYDNKAATQASYEEASNQYTQARNQLTTAKSDLQRAQVNLSYSRIYSPIDGVVLSKSVEQGQTVASSFNTPTIFTIANDLTKMQVEADVDEADIGQVKVGQPVTFTVDAFPDDVFTGTVKQIRLEPTETQNVITYTVIIDAPNADMKLMPGMTASVSIVVEKESGVAIPMESLFFTLDQMEMEKLSKVGFSFKKLYNTKEEETNSLKDITKKTIWVGNGKQFEQRSVTPGINDGATSLIKEGLKEGEHVVVGTRELSGKPDGKSGSNPFMPGPPQRTKR
ncbi:MAG: efflux RND transporter periplasmic adaptor subunit [Bacteroidales bacterium]|nr:efflux RND transporter periplasmic adaptor subunit [Bacteroidales bacterium]